MTTRKETMARRRRLVRNALIAQGQDYLIRYIDANNELESDFLANNVYWHDGSEASREELIAYEGKVWGQVNLKKNYKKALKRMLS